MSQAKIRQILRKFDAESVLEEGLLCGNSSQKWEQFIKNQFIAQERVDEFRGKLNELGILQKTSEIRSYTPFLVEDQTGMEFQAFEEHELQLNRINVGSIRQYRWSTQLMNQIMVETRERLKLSYSKAIGLESFLQLQADNIIDILFRRVSLKAYFDEIGTVSKKLGNKYPLFRVIRQMSFSDFIIYVIRFSKQKGKVSALISQQGIAIPLTYHLSRGIGHNSDAIFRIIGAKQFRLILSIGTPSVKRQENTSFLAKLFTLRQEFNEECNSRNILNLYTKISIEKKDNFLLADFNGGVSKSLSLNVQEIIRRYGKHSELLLIHTKEQDIMKGIFQQPIYIQLFQHAGNVIVYVKDRPKRGKGILLRNIPEQFWQKVTIRILVEKEKLSQKDYKDQYEHLSKTVTENSHRPRFKYERICGASKLEDINSYKQLVSNAMSRIERQNYQITSIIPNIYIYQRISELSYMIKEETASALKIKQYEQERIKLKNELLTPTLTQFVQIAVRIIQAGQICTEMFAQSLENWKKRNCQPLRDSFLQLSERLKNEGQNVQLRQQISKNQVTRGYYQISVDKIINQLIIYNKVAKKDQYTKIVKDHYLNSFKDVSPINIVDGKTLQFGSYALQQTIYEMSQKYAKENKKLYVVSVIGNQSSAKSTLLNYLFRCKFETSAGRCTKGVYMSLCQLEDMVIVVLDTEGLLSVSAQRDPAFDNQIASFILKVSNLIIINNKGQLATTLQHMLQVCLYVLESLHKDEKQENYQPQKLLFALRDHIKPEIKIQQEQSNKIRNALQGYKIASQFDYKNFFTIETSDVFCLPSAFTVAEGLVASVNRFNSDFGQCVYGMRARIVNYLKKTPSQKNLKQIYQLCNRTWTTVQKCGQNIMRYTTFDEIVTKKQIQQRLRKRQLHYSSLIQKNYQQFFEKIKDIQSYKGITVPSLKDQLLAIKDTNIDTIFEDFQSICKQIIFKSQWIKDFLPQIQRTCLSYECTFVNQFHRMVLRIKYKEQEAKLKRDFINIIDTLLQQDIEEASIKEKFRQQTKNLLQSFKQAQKGNQQELNIQIIRIFNKILSEGNYAELKIQYIGDCQGVYLKWAEPNQLKELFKIEGCQERKREDEVELDRICTYLFKEFQQNITYYMKTRGIHQPTILYDNREYFRSEIINTIYKGKDMLNKFNKKSESFFATIYDPTFKLALFGSLYRIAHIEVHKIKQMETVKRCNEMRHHMGQFQENLGKIFRNKEKIIANIDDDIDYLFAQLKDNAVRECQQIIEDAIDKISLKFTPQGIFRQAIKQTLNDTQRTNRKQWYLRCFKLVTNINRYLFEIMCRSQEIMKRDIIVKKTIASVLQKTKKKALQIEVKLRRMLQVPNQLSDHFELNCFLSQHNLIGIAHCQMKQCEIKDIILMFKSKFTEKIPKFTQDLKQALPLEGHLEKISNFIKTDLKDKIIGCPITCPTCSMKCMLPKGHEENHKVPQGCHTMSAFGRCRFVYNSEPVLTPCHSEDNIRSIWFHRPTNKNYPNLKAYIQSIYPDWDSDFPDVDEEHRFQTFAERVNLLTIWANIEDAVRATSCIRMKKSSCQEIQQLRDSDELVYLEIYKNSYYDPFTKGFYKLRGYLY